MKLIKWLDEIPAPLRLIFIYYFLYLGLFCFCNLILLTLVSFFHFLLDHDMNTIENWLNRNTWEVLSLSKILSGIGVYKYVKLNQYSQYKFFRRLKEFNYFPSKKIIGVVLFILVLFYALILQFGGGIVKGQLKEELFYSSFFGSSLFYLIDILLIFFLVNIFELVREHYNKVMYGTLFGFIISTKIVLPYLSKFYIFIMIHFLTLFYLGRNKRFTDAFYYAILVISPLSAVYGLDLVWDNNYSLIVYQKDLPLLGILCMWTIAIYYYHHSKAD